MLLKLALKDLFFDRLISSCQVAAIASILAPLLLLFSLRYGIVNELENKLLQDPTVLSLTLDSSAQLDSAFFDKLLEDQDVGFVIPEVSALSALVNLHFGNRIERVAVMATALGDPIVENSNISFDSSASVAHTNAHTNNVPSSNEASNAKAASQKTQSSPEQTNQELTQQTQTQGVQSSPEQTNQELTQQTQTQGIQSSPEQTNQELTQQTQSQEAQSSPEQTNQELTQQTQSQEAQSSQEQTNQELTQPNQTQETQSSQEYSNQEQIQQGKSQEAQSSQEQSNQTHPSTSQDIELGSKIEQATPPEVANSKAEQSWLKGGLADNEVLVTEDLARKYNIQTGNELKVVVSRTKDGKNEAQSRVFTVKGIIKQRFVNDDFLAVNIKVLKAIDDYRLGFEPAIFSDGSNERTTKRTYAKFRLFAKSIDSVIPLYNKLIKQGLNVSSKVGQIENIQAIARVLNFIFIVIALVSGIGGALALSGLMLSSLKSRKRNFVLLRLMGQSRRETYFLVLLENVMLSSLGFILAWAFYMAGSQVFNQYFGAMLPEAVISHLTLEHGLIFYLSTVLIAALLALWSAKYIFLKAHIADVLREA